MSVPPEQNALAVVVGDVCQCCPNEIAAAIYERYELTPRPPAPGPLCGDRYAGDLVCGQPAGHPVVVADPDTWHRHAHTRWC